MIDQNERFDVAIIGSGFAGSMLATCLARNGVSVLLVESDCHPRFAIGESTIPGTILRLKLIAARYDVPELMALTTFDRLRDQVSPASGVKRGFSFAYHREGQSHQGKESNQLPTLTPPVGPDVHYFRQDIDFWLTTLAMQYGVVVKQKTKVDVQFDRDGAMLQDQHGRKYHASYLVDGAGFRSPVAQQLGLRQTPTRFRTNTRTLFTHMTGVQPYDLVGPARSEHQLPVPISQSTLHHIFDGGWFWVIPFDNHCTSTNPCCSVGLTLDRRKFPESDMSADDEFQMFVERFPSVRRHFEMAQAVRPWVKTGRLQYSSSRVVGERFSLLPHSAGLLDALFSSGLSLAVHGVDMLASRLLEAVDEQDFSTERFQDYEDFLQNSFDHYDEIIVRAFDTWEHYELWNAWSRLWSLGNVMSTWGELRRFLKWRQTHDRRYLDEIDSPGKRGVMASQLPEFCELLSQSSADVEAVKQGKLNSDDASRRIFSRIAAVDFLPPFLRFGEPDNHTPAAFTLPWGLRQLIWYHLRAPAKWREYCAFSIATYAREALSYLLRHAFRSTRHVRQTFRDVFFLSNRDWQKRKAPPAPNPPKRKQSPQRETTPPQEVVHAE